MDYAHRVPVIQVASLHNDFNILYLFFIWVFIAVRLCKRTRLNIVNGIFVLYTVYNDSVRASIATYKVRQLLHYVCSQFAVSIHMFILKIRYAKFTFYSMPDACENCPLEVNVYYFVSFTNAKLLLFQ